MTRAAVFLDRDGVLTPDLGARRPGPLELLPGVAPALARLAAAGFALVVVTNQTAIARGLASEAEIDAQHAALAERLRAAGAPAPERFFVCPHHPRATLEAYRVACECRKPRPGLLLRAARELDLALARSFMVGDRPSDVAAGRRAGCRTCLVTSGKHDEPPIETDLALDPLLDVPDLVCADLAAAAEQIVGARP